MRALFNALAFLGPCLCASTVAASEPADQEHIQAFSKLMHQEYQLDPQEVSQKLALATKNQAILDAIARPWEAKPWYQYYPIFLTEKRLAKGLEFWQTHNKTLQRAEEHYGVPAEIIVAIIGVETFYGTYKGKYSVLDALYTLGFHYPPRAKFFKSELEQYFLLAQEEGFDVTQLKGSYAGAMGWGQFISSSYRHYAVDFDNDGVRDLLNNPVDAIGSVANYFARHGWQADQAVAFKATIADPAQIQPLLGKSLKYQHSWSDLQSASVAISPTNSIEPQQSVRLFDFELENGTEYWVGMPNFYVITRYNHSPLYAMAVYQFSQQLKSNMAEL